MSAKVFVQDLQRTAMILSMNTMLKNNIGTDTVFQCFDGEVYAHRIVLMAGSEYFTTMFSLDMQEKKKGTVNLNLFTKKCVSILISFLYGNLKLESLTPDIVTSALSLSHMTNTTGLFQLCWTVLLKHWTAETAVELWDLAELYEQKELIYDYIYKNFEVIREQNFVVFSRLTESKITEFISHNNTEEPTYILIDLIWSWGRSGNDDRLEATRKLLNAYASGIVKTYVIDAE